VALKIASYATKCQSAIRSIGWDTKLTARRFSLFMYGYRFLSRGFTDRREILHGVAIALTSVQHTDVSIGSVRRCLLCCTDDNYPAVQSIPSASHALCTQYITTVIVLICASHVLC